MPVNLHFQVLVVLANMRKQYLHRALKAAPTLSMTTKPKIEIDLSRIATMAKTREDENWAFRIFLKSLEMRNSELDAIVHGIQEAVASQIDCTQCGNCCKEIRPTLDAEDVQRFAIGLEMTVDEFSGAHLNPVDIDNNELMFKELPCQFLDGTQCSQYDLRPAACRDFPHLHKSGFRDRLISVVFNYETCPIVYNVYERLKLELWTQE